MDQPFAHVDDVLALVRGLRLVGRIRLTDAGVRLVPAALDRLRLGVAAGRMAVARLFGVPALRVARVATALPLAEGDRRSDVHVAVALLLGHIGRVRLLSSLVAEGGRLLAGLALTVTARMAVLFFRGLRIPAVLLG